MFKRIVKFKDGKYGVRRWGFGWEFLDMRDLSYWWSSAKDEYAYAIHGTIEQARAGLNKQKKKADKGKAVRKN